MTSRSHITIDLPNNATRFLPWPLGRRRRRTRQSARVVLAWLAAGSRSLSEPQIQSLNQWEPAADEALRQRCAHEAPLRQAYDTLLRACQDIDARMPDTQRYDFIDAAIRMAVADQRLRAETNHALRFVADLMGVPLPALEARFRKRTGRALPRPSDPSRASYWAARGGHTKAASQPVRQASAADRARQTLGVGQNADAAAIKLAYRRLASRTHPDRMAGQSDTARRKAEDHFREVRAAYEYLVHHA